MIARFHIICLTFIWKTDRTIKALFRFLFLEKLLVESSVDRPSHSYFHHLLSNSITLSKRDPSVECGTRGVLGAD